MKKLTILFSLLMIISTSLYAQKGKARTAYNYYQNGNLIKATKLIDEAILHKKTINDAETWVFRGEIYIGVIRDASGLLDQDGSALGKASESYEKAKELDTAKKFDEQITSGYGALTAVCYNRAVEAYNANDYKIAGKLFTDAYNYSEVVNKIDTSIIYNAAVAYNLADDSENAALWYDKLIEFEYDNPSIYTEYTNILNSIGNKDRAFEVISIGREIYPENYLILISEANLFLETDQTEKALINLEKALSFEDANFSIYHAIGTIYNMIFEDTKKNEEDRLLAYDKAVFAYTKAVELKADFFDAYFNLGALIFNKGVFYLQKADELPFGDKGYDALKQKGDDIIVEALPYLEKAHELNPEDNSTLFSLKQIYSRTGNSEKYQEIDQKMKDLGL